MMEKQQQLFKGELMEELLRRYFYESGYFVVRGLRMRYKLTDISDVDLWLYSKGSIITRHRINVDIKNKKNPQVCERIVWANGLMKILNLDSCIVATTDSRPIVHDFAKLHSTTVLDGHFLSKLRSTPLDRRTEEDLLDELSKLQFLEKQINISWKTVYENSKSKLLTELDFAGFNSSLNDLQYFIEKAMSDTQKRQTAVRMVYITLGHALVILDYLMKDIVFSELPAREKRLEEGLKYGNLGKEGIDNLINLSMELSGTRAASTIRKTLDDTPTDIMSKYFSRTDVLGNLFIWAKQYEAHGFKIFVSNPNDIEAHLKATISVFLDFFGIERKAFFESILF